MNTIELSVKKAELISNNKIFIPKNIKLPYPLSKSTSGPGSGLLSIAIKFENKNIKLIVTQDQNESFSLRQENDNFQILKDGEIFLKNVKILPILFHAPSQAFLNIEARCIYNCAFCHLSQQEFFNEYNEERFFNLILKVSNRRDFQAIAITSGVYPSYSELINKICNIVKKLRQKFSDIPIGVETCISKQNELLMLKKAGVDEIKINIQSPDKDLFNKICPDFEYDNIFNNLKKAVKLFGKGKVTSNIIYGLGESDESVKKTIEKLAIIGVVPTLRKVRVNKFVKKKLEEATSNRIYDVSTDRILKISHEHKKILERYELTTKTFKTMCHKCGCCDIVPFWDI